MSHGYCKFKDDGTIRLAFTPTAMSLKGMEDKPLYELWPCHEMDAEALVVRRQTENRGFLWYLKDKEEAHKSAEMLTTVIGEKYYVTPVRANRG